MSSSHSANKQAKDAQKIDHEPEGTSAHICIKLNVPAGRSKRMPSKTDCKAPFTPELPFRHSSYKRVTTADENDGID